MVILYVLIEASFNFLQFDISAFRDAYSIKTTLVKKSWLGVHL